MIAVDRAVRERVHEQAAARAQQPVGLGQGPIELGWAEMLHHVEEGHHVSSGVRQRNLPGVGLNQLGPILDAVRGERP